MEVAGVFAVSFGLSVEVDPEFEDELERGRLTRRRTYERRLC